MTTTKEIIGYYIDGECLVCPACLGYQATDNIENAYDTGYPDGFTCADCGVVK